MVSLLWSRIQGLGRWSHGAHWKWAVWGEDVIMCCYADVAQQTWDPIPALPFSGMGPE